MTRLITYLTLIPTFFTFIAIVLINVGGVNPDLGSKYQLMRERNSAFSLVNWDYTFDPPNQSSGGYSYHLFLNRLCVGYKSVTNRKTSIIHSCRNDRLNKLQDGTRLYSSTTVGRYISPFRFNTVNLDVPLAFYMMSAILVVLLMFIAPAAARGEKTRSIRKVGALCTGLAFVFMIIASSVITAQMVQLRNQIRDDTRSSARVPNRYGSSGSFSGTSTWRIDVTNVSLGMTVLGLTWAAVVALGIEFVMWVLAFTGAAKETPVVETKEDKYVQG